MVKFDVTLEDIKKRMTWETLLTPIAIIPSERPSRYEKSRFIVCKCKCGNTTKISYGNFINYHAMSCGRSCPYYKETLKKSVWANQVPKIRDLYKHIIRRCYNPNDADYKHYGGRGVKMCDEWLNNYQTFLDWCLANGWKEGLQIDKDIKGTGLIYSPETCMFVTQRINATCKRNSIRMTLAGKEVCLKTGTRMTGMKYKAALNLVKRHGFTTMEEIIAHRLKRAVRNNH